MYTLLNDLAVDCVLRVGLVSLLGIGLERQERVPTERDDIDTKQSVASWDERKVDCLERRPHSPVCDNRGREIVLPALLDLVHRLELHGAHDRKVEGDGDGGEEELVGGDAGEGGGDVALAGLERGLARDLDLVEERVPLVAEGAKDEAAVEPGAQAPARVVSQGSVGRGRGVLGHAVAHGKEGLREWV